MESLRSDWPLSVLYLVFQLGESRLGLAADRIVHVLPRASLEDVPQAPPGVAGALRHGTIVVPVIDPSVLALGRPASGHMSTRIVLATVVEPSAGTRILGLMLERATQTTRDFVRPVEVDDLLSDSVRHFVRDWIVAG